MTLKTILMVRTERSPDGTFGSFDVDGLKFASGEDDWFNGRKDPNGSCIPAGRYTIRRRWSPKHKCEVFGVVDVPGFQDVEIHAGNTEEDTLGCILLGTRLGQIEVPDEDDPLRGRKLKRGVVNSRIAIAKFMELMHAEDEAILDISWLSGVLP